MRIQAAVITVALAVGAPFAQGQMDWISYFQGQGGGQRANANEQREIQLYNEGTAAKNSGQWDAAMAKFDEAAKLNGRRAAGSLYWKAYAQSKQGQRSAALTTIQELRKNYADSSWARDAAVLEGEIRGAGAQTPTVATGPQKCEDEDIKLLAIQQLMDRDEARALPIIERILAAPSCDKLKERALFVLAQSDSPRALSIVEQTARSNQNPRLQAKAIEYLGVHGGRKNLGLLSEIYSGVTDVKVKRKILEAFMIADDKQRLYTAATTEKNPDVQRHAVDMLGAAGATAELKQLWASAASVDVKRKIIDALGIVAGDEDFLMQVAQNDPNPDLKRKAIDALGVNGKKNVPFLLQIYASNNDYDIKRKVVDAIMVAGDARALVDLAKKEQDPKMKRVVVDRLSVMDEKEATDYLISILDK